MLAAIDMTDQEQLLLELVNRARANPEAEAARYKIELNKDLKPDEISKDAKQPLAPHPALIASSRFHSQEMLDGDWFAHDNPVNGDGPSDRARDAGYPVGAGENIAWFGTPGKLEKDAEVYRRHEALFLSPPHRTNMMTAGYREIGNGIKFGMYEKLYSIMVTENFGNRGGEYFITGVAFTDRVQQDDFYTIGESLPSLTVTARRERDGATYTTTTGSSGGYALQLGTGIYTVTATGAGLSAPISFSGVTIFNSNVKVDFNARESVAGTLAGVVFEDRDGNGTRATNEPVMAEGVVYLDVNDNARRDPDEWNVKTNSQGEYRFARLAPGNYSVRYELDAGRELTAPKDVKHSVTLAKGEQRTNLDFGSIVVNTRPIAGADQFTVENGIWVPINIFANDRDPDGELALDQTHLDTKPTHGSVAIDQEDWVVMYRGDGNYEGPDFFEYSLRDQEGLASAITRVDLNVIPRADKFWQNKANSLDVNADTFVTSIDALLVLNSLHREGSRKLVRDTNAVAAAPFLDVTGDSFIAPLDALSIINELNRIAAERSGAAANSGTSTGGSPAEGELGNPAEGELGNMVAELSGPRMLLAAAVERVFGESGTTRKAVGSLG